jgi:hypothetical protein
MIGVPEILALLNIVIIFFVCGFVLYLLFRGVKAIEKMAVTYKKRNNFN